MTVELIQGAMDWDVEVENNTQHVEIHEVYNNSLMSKMVLWE